MANTLDLIIKLVIQNQDAVKNLGQELKALSSVSMPDLGLGGLEELVNKIETAISLSDELVENFGAKLETSIRSSLVAMKELVDQSQDMPIADEGVGPSGAVDSSGIDKLSKALGVARNEAETLKDELSLPDESILNAVEALRQFGAIDIPIDEQFAELNKSLGITAADFNKLSKVVFPKIPLVDSSGYKDVTADTVRLAETLGISAAASKKLQQSLNLPTDKIELALAKLQQFEGVDLPIDEQFRALNKELGISQSQFDKLKNIKVNPQGVEETRSGLGRVFDTASKVSFGFNNIVQSIQTMVAAARPAYEYLIGANERLNQQLLQSAASITATSAVSGADGAQLKNIDSIRALQPKLKETIREVEIATQSLVGVTSADTSEVFNTILRNTGALNGQLKEATGEAQKFKDPLDAAAKLAPGLVATLGTLGLPLAQASEEINSLLKGEIDQSAQVAKSLGITRQMVENWKAQGTLVDNLTKKFDPFLKANAEAARSVGGITSNIRDIFEIMGREAGKPLTEGFISALDLVEKSLKKIMPSVQVVFTSIIEQAVAVATKVGDAIAPAFKGLGVAIGAIAPSIGPIFQSILQNVGNLFAVLKPIAELIGSAFASIGTAIGAILPSIVALFNTLSATFQGTLSIAVGILGTALSVVAESLKIFAGALAAISADPIGKVLIQVVLLAAVIAPIASTLLAVGGAVSGLISAMVALAGTAGGIGALGGIIASLFPGFAAAIVSVLSFGASVATAFGAAKLFLAPIVAAFAGGGLSAGISAVGVAIAGLGPAFAAAKLAAAPFLALLLPLIALGGAIAVTLVVKGAKDIENTQQELDDLQKTTNDISDNALKNAGKLKALAAAAASGGLSAEQKKEQKDLLFGTKQQIKLIDDQIAATKELKQERQGKGASDEQLATFDKLIQQLEGAQKAASKQADAVTIASQALADLGTTNEQVAQKVKAAQGIIDGGVGDPAKFKESAKLLSDLTQKQVELGIITADEGAKTLAKLQNNTKLDYESQLAAKEAIVKLYQSRFAKIDELQSTGQLSNAQAEQELEAVRTNTELQLKVRVEAGKKLNALRKETSDAELAEVGAQTAEIAAKKATGAIGEAEAAKQTSATRLAESKIRITQQQEEAANELNPEVRRKLEAEVRKSQAEITKIEAEERDRRNAERLKDFDERAKILQAGLDKGRVTEEQFNDQRAGLDAARSAEELKQLNEKFSKLNKTDKEGREAIQAQIAEAESKQEANKKAANDREIATLQQALDKTADLVRDNETNKKLEVEQAIASGVKTRADGESEIAKVAIEGAEAIVEAEKSKLDKLKSFPPFLNPKENEALQNQIRDQENKTSELQLGLIRKRIEAERSALEERKKLIDEEYNRKNQASKNQDLDSQLELEKAVLGGSITRAEADNKLAQSSKSRIDAEFAAEKDKYDKLSNLKPLTNPEEERRRQDSLRAAEEKLKNAELAGVKKAQEVKRSNEEVEKNIANDRKQEAEKDQKAAEETAKSVLDEIVAANRAADLEINRSKALRLEASKTADFEALKKTGFDAEKIAREGAARELKIEQETLDTLYKMKVAQSADLARSIEDNEISGPAAIEAVAQLQKEVSDLNLKRIDLEKKALEQLRAEKVRQIELESQASINPLQKKIDLLTQQKTLLEQQNSLIGAQDRLENASFNLAKQRSGFAIEDAKAAGNEAGAKALEVEAARDQLKFTQLQNASKIESITLGLQQKAIDTDMARLQSQIALLQSQANLEKAIAEGKSKAQIDALTREVGLRSQQVELTAKAAENQKIISGKDLAAAKIEGQIALERDQRALDKAAGIKTAAAATGFQPGVKAEPFEAKKNIPEPTPPPKPPAKEPVDPAANLAKPIDAVAKGSDSLGKSLGKAVDAIDQFSAKLTTGKTNPIAAKTATAIPARFSGGPIGAGEFFTGAELGPELAHHSDGSYQMLLMPGIYSLDRSAQIIPAQQTQQILQNSPMMTSVVSTTIAKTDNTDMIHELRQLRSVVTQRRPQLNVPVSFAAPQSDGADRSMAALSRMLIRSGI